MTMNKRQINVEEIGPLPKGILILYGPHQDLYGRKEIPYLHGSHDETPAHRPRYLENIRPVVHGIKKKGQSEINDSL